MGRKFWRNRILERRIRRTCYYSNGRPLDRLSLPLTEAVVEYFSKNAPFDDLDIEYASEISYAGAVSPSVLIVAMIYLERMRLMNKDHFESSDPADLFSSALLCAFKFLYDEAETEFVYNDEWAMSCSRSLDHVNQNELKFLDALDWNTMARENDFYQMLRNFEKIIAKRQSQWRGFSTYADLSVWISNFTDLWNDVLIPAFTVIGLATLTYTATVVGLYACSLHLSTMNKPTNKSGLDIASNLPPLSPLILHRETTPSENIELIETVDVEDIERVDQSQKKAMPSIADLSSRSKSRDTVEEASNNGSSLCLNNIKFDDILLETSWTTWFFNRKALGI